MKLLQTAVLFICLGCLVQGKVVSDFTGVCDHVFVGKKPPTFNNFLIPDTKRQNDFYGICQTLNCDTLHHDYVYATLYDIKNKIPVYSAYRYYTRELDTVVNRDAPWKIEPQLDGSKVPCMTQQRSSKIPFKDRGRHQALNRDYAHSSHDKGHLFPVNHAQNQDVADATFTLTNAAPQNCDFNKKWYNMVESVVSKDLDKYCKPDTAHIVTGVIPSLAKFINGVNVPSHFWTAYCCLTKDGKKKISGSCLMHEKDDEPSCGRIQKLENSYLKIKPFGGYC